jgi:hypothetical protein
MTTSSDQKLVRTLDWLAYALFACALGLLAVAFTQGCGTNNHLTQPPELPDLPQYQFEASGEDFLISALDEVHAIADWVGISGSQSGPLTTNQPPRAVNKMILSKAATDTVYIYGQITSGGYGAVVTERYAHPKGLLLITVRKSFGRESGHIVTETNRYISYADLQNERPQQTNVTEMYGLSSDTILTSVLRNGTLQTYTFRLPVVTRVVNPDDGSVRITTRYAENGSIVSEVRDDQGTLIQRRTNYGQTDGSLVTRTEYTDGSWRQVRTCGQADGSILRETTSSPSSSLRQH